MIISGKELAEQIYQELANTVSHLTVKPHVTIVTCAPTAATYTYLTYKLAAAKRVGIRTSLIELPAESTTADCITAIEKASMQTDGIVVQLPLPAHIDTETVIASIPPSYDVDGLRYPKRQTMFLPPVAAAVAEIVRTYGVTFVDKKVVVVGYGRLVGQACTAYLQKIGIEPTVVTETTEDKASIIASADVLILGTGQPSLITPAQIKEGVLIFDAGTAELGGKLRGDADPSCAEKASLFTPVPNGIGPLTIATLLKNCLLATTHE